MLKVLLEILIARQTKFIFILNQLLQRNFRNEFEFIFLDKLILSILLFYRGVSLAQIILYVIEVIIDHLGLSLQLFDVTHRENDGICEHWALKIHFR